MSAELLRRAAETLRSSAGMASEGPWQIGPDADGDITLLGPNLGDPDEHNPDDSCYVALVHPPVALALANCMDQVAWMGELDHDLLNRVGMPELIAVARAILREEDTR